MTNDGQAGPTPAETPDLLIAEVQRVLALVEQGGPDAVEAARAAFASRSAGAEAAFLVRESMAALPPAGVPGGHTPVAFLTFESEHAVIELEVRGGADRELVGQVLARSTSPFRVAPAAILIEHSSGPTAVESDRDGRFAVSGLAPGPLRLRCHPPGPAPQVVSDWVAI